MSAALLAPLLAPALAFADANGDLRDLYRGARAQAMGNAFVAIADDEEALYYNPAGLAGITSTNVQYLNMEIEGSVDDVNSFETGTSNFKHLSGDSLNILMGKDFYAHANYAPTVVFPHFGFGVLVDQQASLITKNKAMPNVNIGFQTTNGFQLGYGLTVPGSRRSKSELRLGIGAKILYRRGGYYDLSQQQIINLSKDELKQIIGNFHSAFGWDLGAQYLVHTNNRTTLSLGASYENIGGVKFGSPNTTNVDGNLSLGVAGRYKLGHMMATLAYDCQHLNDSVDYRLRNHIGMEFNVAAFSLQLGMNEIYPTFGVGVDLWLIKFEILSYEEEQSSLAGLDPERRYMLQISMGF